MSKVYIPQDYHTPLSVYEMQRAIEFIKSNFQTNLSNALNLRRVSAPLFVEEASGLNDNLNGYERPVSFDIPDVHAEAQVAHQLLPLDGLDVVVHIAHLDAGGLQIIGQILRHLLGERGDKRTLVALGPLLRLVDDVVEVRNNEPLCGERVEHVLVAGLVGAARQQENIIRHDLGTLKDAVDALRWPRSCELRR